MRRTLGVLVLALAVLTPGTPANAAVPEGTNVYLINGGQCLSFSAVRHTPFPARLLPCTFTPDQLWQVLDSSVTGGTQTSLLNSPPGGCLLPSSPGTRFDKVCAEPGFPDNQQFWRQQPLAPGLVQLINAGTGGALAAPSTFVTMAPPDAADPAQRWQVLPEDAV
ncbi:hypothetical protein [Cryptosporangium sp. NPDC051539]|uniref:hypothetical protein n=1 Tax=Cryptosporangium sp. NPDC051539 TaxID=3363962 RepID=UPI0037A7312A